MTLALAVAEAAGAIVGHGARLAWLTMVYHIRRLLLAWNIRSVRALRQLGERLREYEYSREMGRCFDEANKLESAYSWETGRGSVRWVRMLPRDRLATFIPTLRPAPTGSVGLLENARLSEFINCLIQAGVPIQTASMVLQLILAWAAWKAAGWAFEFVKQRFGRSYSLKPRLLDASQTMPMCYGCNRENVDAFTAADGDFEKKLLIPRACEYCSRWYWLYGLKSITIRCVAKEANCTASNTRTFFTDGKPVNQAEVNRVAMQGDRFTARDWMYMHNVGLIHHLEIEKMWWFSRFTGRITYASTWKPCKRRPKKKIGEERLDPAPTRGRLCDIVAQLSAMCSRAGGLFPQTLLVSDHTAEDDRLASVDAPNDEVARSSGLFPTAVGPPGSDVCALFGRNAIRIGPLLGNPSVWNSRAWQNRVGCIIYRSKPKAVYNPTSNSAGRLSVLMNKFIHKVLTPKAINEAYLKVLHEYPTRRDLVSKKFTQQQLDDIARRLERATIMVNKTTGQGRKGQVKHEMVAKEGKPPRAVIDEGPELLSINSMVSRILEVLVFDKDLGIFHRLSIKHRPRVQLLDAIQREWQTNGWSHIAAAEVDQTAMELHERFNPVSGGVLGPIYQAIGVIAQQIDGYPRTGTVRHMINNIKVDVDGGVNVRYKLRVDGRDTFVRVHYEDVFMTSGWRLTSCVNFLNELFATLIAFTDDPEIVFATYKKKPSYSAHRFLIQDEKFSFKFQRDVAGVVREIKFRPFVEGDDVLAMVSDCLIPCAGDIENRYTELGYSSKIKILSTGRAEFIGAHFLLEEGRITSTWMPALGRYLCKLGVMASSNITKESIVARCCSIAVMFATKLPSVAEMFHKLATSHLDGCNQDYVIKPEQYSEEERTFGADEITLREVLNKTLLAIGAPGPDMGEQLRLVRGSFEADVSEQELAYFYQLAPRIHKDYGDAAAFGFLPACLRDV